MIRVHLASKVSNEQCRQIQAVSPRLDISVGRGQVIDDAALYRALKEGWIRQAGLDVWADTPLPSDSPYFDLPNVIITPHMSGISQSVVQRVTDLFCENLRRYLADEPLLNLIDKRLGFPIRKPNGVVSSSVASASG